MTHRLIKYLFFCTLLLLAVAVWRKDVLPDPKKLQAELLAEPEQTPVQMAPLEKTVGGIDYKIAPLYAYDLYGLVVSRHDSDTWWDYAHKEWNDKLNVADLCVVWGNNVRTGSYREISFSSGQWVCNFSTGSQAAWEAFDVTAASNNHLITANRTIAKQIAAARIGDQIHFRGYLAEYSHNHGFPFKRGTSTVRTDTGNGACETVYVEKFEILQRGGGPWHALFSLAILLLIAEVVAWFAIPMKVGDGM